jgi:Plasmid stability protein
MLSGFAITYLELLSLIAMQAVLGDAVMASITVRNLPDETHRALRVRAAQNGRSTEAEVREILEEAVRPKKRLKIGSELAAFGDKHKLDDLNIQREAEVHRIASFE